MNKKFIFICSVLLTAGGICKADMGATLVIYLYPKVYWFGALIIGNILISFAEAFVLMKRNKINKKYVKVFGLLLLFNYLSSFIALPFTEFFNYYKFHQLITVSFITTLLIEHFAVYYLLKPLKYKIWHVIRENLIIQITSYLLLLVYVLLVCVPSYNTAIKSELDRQRQRKMEFLSPPDDKDYGGFVP